MRASFQRFRRDTRLRDQWHSTFAKLIRRAPPNHVDERGGHDEGDEILPVRVQIISAIANGKGEPGTPSTPDRALGNARRYDQKFANSIFVLYRDVRPERELKPCLR
jgi:hypothetical protein